MSNGGGTTSSAAACRLQSTNAKIRKESKAGVSANCELPESIIHKENENMKYDYLVVGAGLFGAAFAQMAKEKGKRVLVIDKRSHIAGNIYTEDVGGIAVHRYGAHIFHTDDEEVWQYANRFATFNRFTNAPLAKYQDRLYHMPFNMNTFYAMWGVTKPNEAREIIERQRKEITGEPQNLEEQAISLVGTDIYEKLIKGYTEKQWGRPCTELPSFIIKRLPVRLTFDNNYFNALYQGIPVGGYTKMIANMLGDVEVRLNTDYFEHKEELDELAEKVIYTGPIDAYFDYKLGELEYRSVRFETEVLDQPNFQGNAAVNYTDAETPWTRIIEHKWFEFGKDEEGNDLPKTVISREYSSEWKLGDEPYYPVNDEKNGKLYEEYKKLAEKEENIIFGGRLGEYKYYDMDAVIAAALDMCEKEL
jgi:UDP-galactopyranose mutase